MSRAAPATTIAAAVRSRPLFSASRVDGIDLARGLAIVGMLAAHLVVIPDIVWSDPQTFGGIVHGRSSILFATLAGVSIGLITGGPRPMTGPALSVARFRLLVRAAAIWVVGAVLIVLAVPVYVILPAYAILFVLAAGALRLRSTALFAAAAGVALIAPFPQAVIDAWPFWSTPAGDEVAAAIGWQYPFPVWIAFVLAGMGAARLDLRRRRTPWLLAVVGGALFVVAAAADLVWGRSDDAGQTPWTGEAHSSGVFEVVGSGGFALLVIGVSVLLCRTPVTWLALPLRAVGSMPLTAYAAHIVVWALTQPQTPPGAFELDVYRELEPFWPMTVGILAACTLWAVLVGRGPLEAGIDRFARMIARDRPTAGAQIGWTNER